MGNTNKKVKNIPEDIQNCLSIAERELLYELAKDMPPGRVIVEIANKASESTEALVRGAEIDGKRVYNLPLYSRNNSTKKTNICGTENKNGLNILDGSACDLARHWKETVGLLAVIGYEQCDEVRVAVICMQHHLSPDSVVAVHDRTQHGPARAIKDLLTDLGNFVLWQTLDNLTVLIADRCQHYWVINSKEIGNCRNCGRKRDFKRLTKQATSLGTKKTTMRSYSMT